MTAMHCSNGVRGLRELSGDEARFNDPGALELGTPDGP
jgi:hypothetical protein